MIQLQALNYILAKKDSQFITYNNLDETYFSDYITEFHFIQDHIRSYGSVPDIVSFLNQFPNFDIIEVNEPVAYLIDELCKDRNKRSLAKTFNEVRKFLNDGKVQEAMDLYTAAADLAVKARNKKLALSDLEGGSFTITNGGVFGSLMSTPIINGDQAAILGMHNIVQRPIAVNGEVEVRPMMYVALSYDHRIINGKESVGFLKMVKDLIENPEDLLLEA